MIYVPRNAKWEKKLKRNEDINANSVIVDSLIQIPKGGGDGVAYEDLVNAFGLPTEYYGGTIFIYEDYVGEKVYHVVVVNNSFHIVEMTTVVEL